MVRGGRPEWERESASANEVGVEAGRKTVNRQQMNFSYFRFPPTHHASFVPTHTVQTDPSEF